MIKLKEGQKLDGFNGYTVIIPSICVGNAAQLACDLLIASKGLKRVGTISHPALVPVYGPAAYQHEPEEKVAACEVYACQEDKLLVLQFRSPFISRHTADFHDQLSSFVKGASKVIILSGSFGFEKRVIESSPYEFKANDLFKEKHAKKLEAAQWNEFKGEAIFGGGNALQLYKILTEQSVPTMVLFRYLLEGDNFTDAKELNELCEDFLELKSSHGGMQLIVPASWKLLFGNDVPELIF